LGTVRPLICAAKLTPLELAILIPLLWMLSKVDAPPEFPIEI
jgi:hypothetical protein